MSRLQRRLRRLAGLCVLVAAPVPAIAQTSGGPHPAATAERAFGILTDVRTALGATWLPKKDERYNWDIDVNADMDVLDVGFLRANVFFNLETIAGTEFRRVDPNQTNFTLDTSVFGRSEFIRSIFGRAPRAELGAVFHHASRHRPDRANRRGISWNMLGVVYGEQFTWAGTDIRASVRALKTIERSPQVDYEGEIAGFLETTSPLNSRVALYVDLTGVIVPVDTAVFDRGTRSGGGIEGGLRVGFRGAALELHGGWEGRIDADPIALETERWGFMGFRVVTPTP